MPRSSTVPSHALAIARHMPGAPRWPCPSPPPPRPSVRRGGGAVAPQLPLHSHGVGGPHRAAVGRAHRRLRPRLCGAQGSGESQGGAGGHVWGHVCMCRWAAGWVGGWVSGLVGKSCGLCWALAWTSRRWRRLLRPLQGCLRCLPAASPACVLQKLPIPCITCCAAAPAALLPTDHRHGFLARRHHPDHRRRGRRGEPRPAWAGLHAGQGGPAGKERVGQAPAVDRQ